VHVVRRSSEIAECDKGGDPVTDMNPKTNGNGNHEAGCATPAFAENCHLDYRLSRESIVHNAPESSGVYGLFNALWIFVGEADNLRARLLEHLTEDSSWSARYQPSGFAFELVSPRERHRRCQELLDELQPLAQSNHARIAGQ
jgi:hypothetical protein